MCQHKYIKCKLNLPSSLLVYHKGVYLCPLLFATYINELPEHLQHSLTLIFADDTKCTRLIHNVTDCALLQDDIHHAVQRSFSCDLDFNITNCKFIHMSYWNNSLNSSYHNYQSIMTASQCKDLGIIFTPTYLELVSTH